MTTPRKNIDSDTIRLLASAVMDGTATESQFHQLTALLQEDEAARDEYLAYVDMHAMLATEMSFTRNAPEVKQPRQTRALPGKPQALAASIAGLAACLLIAVMWFFVTGSGDDPIPPFSSVALVSDASSELKTGDRLGAETIRIGSGFVRLLFDDGVEVTLAGPAEYELISPGKTRLASGLLTATAPKGAEGFRVDTPSAQVVDLGTSFGIDLRQEGFSRVSVFDGEVEIALPDSPEKRLVTEGEAVRIGKSQEIEAVDFDPEPFGKVWPVSSGIVSSAEVFRFVPPWPKRIRPN